MTVNTPLSLPLTLLALMYGTSDPCRGTLQGIPSANCTRESAGGRADLSLRTDAFVYLILTYIMPNMSSRGLIDNY